jgi:hypothetical protein
MYVCRLLIKIKHNYSIIEKKKVLVMVFSLHKFRHYLLGNKFVFQSYGIGLFGKITTCFRDNSWMVVIIPRV